MERILFTLALLTLLNVSAQNNDISSSDIKTYNELLNKTVDDEKFVGVVAGISRDGEIKWSGASGFSDAKNNVAIDTSMLTRPASIAKPMTAIAVMQLVEQGKIDLDRPIQEYIPSFPVKKEGAITVRHLLLHTSGISAYKSYKETQNKINFPTLNDALDVFKHRDLLATPGKAHNYTTYGYVVLGVIIENVSGLSFEDYMIKNIWQPAGMEHTGVEHYNVIYKNKTLLYHKKKSGKIKLAKDANNLSNRTPGGGFYTTVTDMLKFGNAVINNTLVKETTLKMMLQNDGLKDHGNPYAYGWFLYGGKENPSKVFGHSGGQTGSSAQFLMSLESKTVIVVLANTSGSWGDAIGLSVDLIKEFNKNYPKTKP